jgi:hypothetical protein
VWQYPFIVEPLSPVFKQALEALIAAINERFHTQVELLIHRMIEERVVLSFPDHLEAVQEFKLANERITLYVNTIP